MKNIEVHVLNPEAIGNAEQMMIAMARLTQRGHKINKMEDLIELLDKEYSTELVRSMATLPHPTLQKFGVVNIAVVGASRRFLAQITRHQNEVKFMSGSLQYSNYSDAAQFCVPYEIIKHDAINDGSMTDMYLADCLDDLFQYRKYAQAVGQDAAGYKMPQGMRNVLVISATPYQWKHMISQRTCRRNSPETRYVMLRCWEELMIYSRMFEQSGPECILGHCPEGKMSCNDPILPYSPTDILNDDFRFIRRPIK